MLVCIYSTDNWRWSPTPTWSDWKWISNTISNCWTTGCRVFCSFCRTSDYKCLKIIWRIHCHNGSTKIHALSSGAQCKYTKGQKISKAIYCVHTIKSNLIRFTDSDTGHNVYAQTFVVGFEVISWTKWVRFCVTVSPQEGKTERDFFCLFWHNEGKIVIWFTLLRSGSEWPRVKKCHFKKFSEKLIWHFLTFAWKFKKKWAKCIHLKW